MGKKNNKGDKYIYIIGNFEIDISVFVLNHEC
jgi:hypothetical protein